MTNEYRSYLAHYGVKGQKHGVRRYQNPDGTLTPEGRVHYGIGERREGFGPKAESDSWKKNEAKFLSDEELNRRNTRMQREQQYRQQIDNRHPFRMWLGGALTTVLVATAVKALGSKMSTAYMKTILPKLGAKIKDIPRRVFTSTPVQNMIYNSNLRRYVRR